jgi:hypothetical protein
MRVRIGGRDHFSMVWQCVRTVQCSVLSATGIRDTKVENVKITYVPCTRQLLATFTPISSGASFAPTLFHNQVFFDTP